MKQRKRNRAFSRRAKRKEYKCHCCGDSPSFCWTCRSCNFQICQECMQENLWGLSCNNIEWECPDCGEMNGFGNQ